jgi:hypothetical protein
MDVQAIKSAAEQLESVAPWFHGIPAYMFV